MTDDPLRILLVEDNAAEARLLKETLSEAPGRFALAHAETLSDALRMLAADRFDAILLDLSLPDSRGLDTIRGTDAAAPEVPILVLTGLDDEALALEAIRHGAQDYLVKGQADARLMARAIHYALQRKRLEAERKRAEEALRLSEQRFRHAVDNLPDVFLIYDADRRIRFVNAVGLSVFRRSLEDLVGRRDEEIWPPEMTGQYVPLLERAIAMRSVERGQISLVFPNGRQAAMQVAYVPLLDGEGRLDQVLAMTHDITEHKLAEQAHEEADRRKDAFLANVSHELRTPMNAILGMTELALEESISPTVRDYLQTAKGSAGVLLALLNELLDYSRIQAGKLTVESIPFVLRATVETTVKTLAVRAQEKGLELVCDLPGGIPDRLVGDPLRLRQILMNLLGNAIKFTHRGEIVLRVRALSTTPDQVQLEFAVADTGIGISAEDQEKIFTPFTQVDASTTRRYGGTGLGLSIASSLVALMGGRLLVQSELGRGSTFSFAAAFARQAELDSAGRLAEGREPPRPPAPEPARRLRVLLAEDTAANRKVVAVILGKRGHDVDQAVNGQQALEMVAGRGYDLILMDVQMPVMDGFQATAAIRALEDPQKARLPIVALTAHAMKGDAERCLAAGMDAYVAKPIDAGELVELVERLAGTGAVS